MKLPMKKRTCAPVAPDGPALVISVVKVTELSVADTRLSPPVGVLVVTLSTCRSALPPLTTAMEVAVAQSLAGLGSPASGGDAVTPVTPEGMELPVQAVLTRLPVLVAVVVISRLGKLAPTARLDELAWSQTTVLPVAEHDQPVPDAPTKASLLRTSTTRKGPAAVNGPVLVTTIVDVSVPPTAAANGVLDLDKERSAPVGNTVTVTDAALLLDTESVVAALMVAVLV
jgi:hypothetical protein